MVPAAPIDEQRRSSVRDIERLILSRIAHGQYRRQPASELSCARPRAWGEQEHDQQGFQSLARQGYTVSRPGLGTFVAKRPATDLG